jgi:hypothetical protein
VKYHGKNHLVINIHIKNEGQESKVGPVWSELPVGGGRVNREGEGGGIWKTYFV